MSRNDVFFILLLAAMIGSVANESVRPGRWLEPRRPDAWATVAAISDLPDLHQPCDRLSASHPQPDCTDNHPPSGRATIVMAPTP